MKKRSRDLPWPPTTPPGGHRGLTILGLGVSGRDVPSPAWRSPGIRGRGTSGQSLGPAGSQGAGGAESGTSQTRGAQEKEPATRWPCSPGGPPLSLVPGVSHSAGGKQPRSHPQTLSCCWVWPGAYRRQGRPPGPGTAGCGGTWRRPAGSSAAGARAPAPAPAPDPAPAPGPAPALSLLWDTKGRWALAPQPDEEQPNPGRTRAAAVPVCAPALPGSRIAVEGKPGVRERCQDRSRGGTSLRTEGGGGHRAFSHDTSLGPHHQGLTS